jgi:hypothetical protein
MSRVPLVIVNPASAGSSTGRSWPAKASDLATHFGPFNCAITEKPGTGGGWLRSQQRREGVS